MKYTKQPITLTEQISILKQRGLIFEDENEALSVLNHISYFRLASYWRIMEENSRIHRFRSGSRFSSVLILYNFDSELRSLVFNALQHMFATIVPTMPAFGMHTLLCVPRLLHGCVSDG